MRLQATTKSRGVHHLLNQEKLADNYQHSYKRDTVKRGEGTVSDHDNGEEKACLLDNCILI